MASGRWFSPAALLLVIAGGAVGVAGRAALTLPLEAGHPLLIPGVTAAVNIVGSFLLGLLVGFLGDRRPALRLFLGTGVLGGFTTYSAFAVQAVATFTAAPVVGLLLMIVSVMAGALAAGVGVIVGRRAAVARGVTLEPEEAR